MLAPQSREQISILPTINGSLSLTSEPMGMWKMSRAASRMKHHRSPGGGRAIQIKPGARMETRAQAIGSDYTWNFFFHSEIKSWKNSSAIFYSRLLQLPTTRNAALPRFSYKLSRTRCHALFHICEQTSNAGISSHNHVAELPSLKSSRRSPIPTE